jgi:hypothetical protein
MGDGWLLPPLAITERIKAGRHSKFIDYVVEQRRFIVNARCMNTEVLPEARVVAARWPGNPTRAAKMGGDDGAMRGHRSVCARMTSVSRAIEGRRLRQRPAKTTYGCSVCAS